MALTPDDVVTKQFQHVRFKEGFDPDEVDDFLDEIVVEWRKTIAENDELKAKLAEYEAGGAPAAAPAPAPAPAAAAPSMGAMTGDAPVASAGIIELAQRLHDEHVAEGRAKHDQLIAEAQTQASAIISEAETRHREEVSKLERERAGLESRITELRNFERDYRSQLRSYIEGKLRDLETTGTSSGATPVSAIGL
ncbi:DivIVA domain-containing protein [Microbacterium thalassium]|uniref:Cell wall synthesis protein Wag31 n=1 Tax=Microbacterium thalassium TaxID=362649 RepID=A0A7X0KUY9_9MICO|nr:DivIVA domain-containing protein [Microbacterium thalassium]MBB6391682.1 DivIVA domain-containing protein [Microbacterium thalassium]GLK24285.1 cell division protein DivIVA [Microbacterium thalassium]